MTKLPWRRNRPILPLLSEAERAERARLREASRSDPFIVIEYSAP